MAQGTFSRSAALAALVAILGIGACDPAMAIDTPAPTIQVVGSDASSRFVPLGVGKSVVIELPRDIKDVLVADPKITNAVVRTARRVYLIGIAVGQTNVFFFDADGKQIAGFDIAVTRDLNGVRMAIKQVLPDSDIRVQGVADGIMLAGIVASPAEAQQAYDIATRLVGDGAKVVNGILVRGRDQVMLKVTVAEVQRDIIKQLGIDINGSLGMGSAVVNFNNTNPFSIPSPTNALTAAQVPRITDPLTGSLTPRLGATLRAMERAGIVRTLAEPNLTAISGESASFLAGGEFPVSAGSTCTPPGSSSCTPTVMFKQFGVSLTFTPVVLSEGRISLKVLTEVSELSTDGALAIPGGGSIPSLKTRRTNTTVEIPSGGVLAMAGLIQEQTRKQINGFPGLMNVPVLGTLFKSQDYVNHQTELVVLVTPYVVRAVAQKDVSRPDDGFADASDPAAVLLGQFNRIYGTPGRADSRQTYHGNYGFILN
jgi:pilus assembly protein CpaC